MERPLTEFAPPRELIVAETEHWLVNQRIGCPLPGFLMAGARDGAATSLPLLCDAALAELGLLLARCTAAIESVLGAERVYVARYGHTPGFAVHFHLLPLHAWIVDLYRADSRAVMDEPDGPEMARFIDRAFCVDDVAPEIVGPSLDEVLPRLRAALAVPAVDQPTSGDIPHRSGER